MRKISLFLALIVFFISIWSSFAQTVYAKQPSDVLKEKLENLLENAPEEIAKEILMSLGIVLIDLDSFWTDSAAIEAYKNYIKDAYAQGLIGIVDSGFFVSQSVVEYTKQVFEDNAVEDVVWVPVITEKNLKASWFSSNESYYKAMSIFSMDNAPSLVGMYRYYYVSGSSPMHMDFSSYFDDDGNYSTGITDHFLSTPVYIDLSNIVFHINGSQFSEASLNSISYLTGNFGNDNNTVVNWILQFIDKNGVNTGYDGWYWNVGNGWEKSSYNFKPPSHVLFNPFYLGSLPSSGGNYEYYVPVASSSSGIHYIPVFINANAYKDWITGQGSYYRFDSGYTGGDITINPNADYSAITDAIKASMMQGVAQGKKMSELLSGMQKAFTDTLNELNGTLGDIEDNTQQSNKWLQKIFELLEGQQKELQDYFADAQESLDQIPDHISSAAQDITNAIQDTGQAIVDAISGITAGGGGSPPVIAPGDYPDGDQVDSSSGKSLWQLLGEGLAKIITAVLDLLKVLIFKGLDALGYLAGVMVDNIGQVFSGIGVYFDNFIGYIDENTFFAAFANIIPDELKTVLVLMFFSVMIAGIIRYAKGG